MTKEIASAKGLTACSGGKPSINRYNWENSVVWDVVWVQRASADWKLERLTFTIGQISFKIVVFAARKI